MLPHCKQLWNVQSSQAACPLEDAWMAARLPHWQVGNSEAYTRMLCLTQRAVAAQAKAGGGGVRGGGGGGGGVAPA